MATSCQLELQKNLPPERENWQGEVVDPGSDLVKILPKGLTLHPRVAAEETHLVEVV